MQRVVVILFATCWLGGVPRDTRLEAAESTPRTAADTIRNETFERFVRPILSKRCFSCHGPKTDKIKGGLQMGSHQSLLQGGDTGPAVVPGDPDASLLIESIRYDGVYEMPPKGRLPQAEIDILTQWVRAGAVWPDPADLPTPQQADFDLETRKQSHWCWQPLANPEVPPVRDAAWPSNSIDRFVLARLEEASLTPATHADWRTLARRASFDLLGIPPAREDIVQLLAHPSERGWNRYLDKLLQSPRFGERWARHWMDLARYAETYGHEYDYTLPFASEYRDYLIRAFNTDLPYDQFLREQVAGDLLKPPRFHPTDGFNESLIGTGFWWLGEAIHAPTDVLGDESDRLDNQVDVLTKAFLGLTVACARCHDHKFDAITAQDYYALAGYAQSTRRQRAFLDSNAGTKKITHQLRAEQDRGTRLVRDAFTGGPQASGDQLRRVLLATHRTIANGIQDLIPHEVQIEAEALTILEHGSGKAQQQRDRRWSGDRQLWWTDAKPGETLELEFQVAESGAYRITLRLTQASDYARVRIRLDEQTLHEQVDLYADEVKQLSIAATAEHLSAGTHRLTCEILGANPSAKPRHMVGIDWMRLERQLAEHAEQRRTDLVADAAREFGLPVSLVQAGLTRVLDKHRSADHPLAVWQKWLLRSGSATDDLRAFLTAEQAAYAEQHQAYEDYLADSELLADFAEGFPEGWTTSGPAFEASHTGTGEWDRAAEGIRFLTGQSAHSGKVSRKLQGSLFTPTFVLKHRQIHLRMAAEDVRLRVYVDGFFMNEVHQLLFAGTYTNVHTGGQVRWQQQRGNLDKYVGHRVFLEIVDPGDGYAALQSVRFADRHAVAPPPLAAHVVDLLAAFEPGTTEELAEAYAQLHRAALRDWSGQQLSPQQHAWLEAWLKDGLSGNLSSGTQQALERIQATQAKREASLPTPRRVLACLDGTGLDRPVFIRGNHRTPGKNAPRRFLSALSGRDRPAAGDGSGRLQLAEAMLEDGQHFVARVAVNRLWHHLMGRGIVASVDNFGVLGQRPTHPLLLDHLAQQLIHYDWSLKRLAKLILQSQTYRMSSGTHSADSVDPANQLWHRTLVRRLQGEAIRDALFYVSGTESTAMYGPSVPIHLTAFMEGRGRPRSGPLDGNRRRAVYIEVRRNFLSPMMSVFDTPVPFSCIGRRSNSNVPAQALIMLNDPLVALQAERWAEAELQSVARSEEDHIRSLYQSAFSRPPRTDEISSARAFLREQRTRYATQNWPASQTESQSWTDLCHVLFNVKEFVFLH